MSNQSWVLCPICNNKTRTKIRGDTELINFPLFCPKCKQETLINASNLPRRHIAGFYALGKSGLIGDIPLDHGHIIGGKIVAVCFAGGFYFLQGGLQICLLGLRCGLNRDRQLGRYMLQNLLFKRGVQWQPLLVFHAQIRDIFP